MGKFGTITCKGASGAKYEFTAYSDDTDFNAIGAVYVITSRSQKNDGSYSHLRIYVGETGDLSTRFDNHHQQDCFDKNKTNCICVYVEENEVTRLAIESDLLDKYDPPCNQQ